MPTGTDNAEATGPIKIESSERRHWPLIPHMIRWFAVPIILAWVFVTVLVNVIVPALEVVGEAHSAPMAPLDAPSMKAMMRLGHNFHEFDSNSTVMIVLEGQQPLGDDAHRYYDNLIRQLQQDHQAHPAHPGLLGRPADRGRRTERRRQGRLRHVEPRRQPRHDARRTTPSRPSAR